MSRVGAFLRHLVAWEQLPRDEVSPPARRPGFWRSVAAWEQLPRDEPDAGAAPRRGFLRWLAAFERLPRDPSTSPPGAARPPHDEGDR